MSSSQTRVSPNLFEDSRAELIVVGIRNAGKSNGRDLNGDGLDDQMFLETCEKIGDLSPEEFIELEELLIEFLLKEWGNGGNCCFRTLEFVVDIFRYICSIAPQEVVLQYLKLFGDPFVPAHVGLCLYPSVLEEFRNRFEYEQEYEDDFLCSIERLKCEKDANNLSSSDRAELALIWKRAFQLYITANEASDRKLLIGFVTCLELIQKLCESDEHRIGMFKSLAMCLHKKPSVTTILISSLMVISLQSLEFTQKSFAGMSLFLDKLVFAASHHKNSVVTDFLTDVVSCFLNSACVPDENLFVDKVKGCRIELRSVDTTKSRNQGGSQEKPSSQRASDSSPSRPAQGSEKYLEMLEKLVVKMKGTQIRFESTSEKERLEKIISDLGSFL